MDMSLDDYIVQKGIERPKLAEKYGGESMSKFARIKYQDEDDDDDDDVMDADDDGFPDVMPKLVPFVPTNKSVKERLGSSRSASNGQIENRVMPVQTLVRPNFKAKNSIQKRLGKNFVNPAVAERNRITVHALKSFASSAQKSLAAPDETNGKFLLDAFTSALELAAPDKKYDMRIQKEICEIQKKELYYTCPGASIVSFDGRGIRGVVSVPQNTTSMTMNQRFA